MSLPATKRPPKDFKELEWQQQQFCQPEKKPTEESPSSTKTSRPKTIVLPFYSGRNSQYARYVEVESEGGIGTSRGQMKIKKAKPIIPGWLVELKDYYLRGVMDIKSILESSQEQTIRFLITSLGKVIREDMEIEISNIEIFNILKNIPMNCDGNYSFSHFMFGIGNPVMAEKSGVFMLNKRMYSSNVEMAYRRKSSTLKSKQEDQSGGDQKRDDHDHDDVKEEEETDTNDPNVPDYTGYNLREKVFFSGLLIFEMYETLKEVENLYALSKIPEPTTMALQRDRQSGFGSSIESIGYGKTAWDKPLPPPPKLSPYLNTVPFVTARWNTSKPGPNEKLKRTFSKLQPLHLAIRPPRKQHHPICITENQARVRQALAYLADKGDCVALLPDIHFVIHLSDTDVDKLEVVTVRESPDGSSPPLKVNHSEEKRLIINEVKKLFRPLILLPQITRLSSKISYTDGLQLREICKHLQRDHWNCISQKKLDFREKVWVRMHVDDMPLGRLRDSFIYAFVTYLPYVSHLPIVCDKNYLV